VELRGRDAEGREFYSATRHYVWGDDVSPWEYLNDSELKLVPDKGKYRPGETARILVQTPVDAELLVTVERGRVLRHYRKTVTVENPVIELPLESGDAPGVYVSVSLVQNGGGRGADGKPLQKLGTCLVQVEAVEKQLQVQLQAPQQKLLPGEPCAVSGGNGMGQKAHRAGACVANHVLQSAALHLGDAVRNGCNDSRALQKAQRLCLLEKGVEHHNGQIVIGHNAVLQRSAGTDVRRGSSEHGQCLLTDGERFARTGIDSYG
jgi:hypothetical protein